MADPSPTPQVTFAEAEGIGVALCERWAKLGIEAAPPREALEWADLVQFVLRTAADVARDREDADPAAGAGTVPDQGAARPNGRPQAPRSDSGANSAEDAAADAAAEGQGS